jgi:catechol 2,3-dioxygenase-like lactoylglutathione lyase family enzyme
MDVSFEMAVIPVLDVDRAKEFYGKLGWRLDADFPYDNGFRVVQLTLPGSGCSVQFGTKLRRLRHRLRQGLYLIVSDVAAARRPGRARYRRERGVPRWYAGRSIPARRDERPRSRWCQLQLLRHVQRPGR